MGIHDHGTRFATCLFMAISRFVDAGSSARFSRSENRGAVKPDFLRRLRCAVITAIFSAVAQRYTFLGLGESSMFPANPIVCPSNAGKFRWGKSIGFFNTGGK